MSLILYAWAYTGTMFFTVTEDALEDLLKGRRREEHPADKVMRVVWENDDYAFKLDTPEFDDLIFTQDGQQVLLVSLDMNEMLGDMKMDLVNRDGKNHFVMVHVD
jgi:Fe-S cluster assembly iron-binding protein IscA